MKIFLTGGSGQLGYELRQVLDGHELITPQSTTLDITDKHAVVQAIQAAEPDVVIHAAAYTKVDQAETEPAIAWRVNVDGSRFVAEAAGEIGARLIAISTDYVFDGLKHSPYVETDQPAPLNIYGQTKWEGEQAILAVHSESLIFRTAWLYGGNNEHGNFVRSILKRVGQNQPLRVVDDQVGSPTSAADLAKAIRVALEAKITPGIYHAVNEGWTNWFKFAQKIVEFIGKPDYPLTPISTASLQQTARRPGYSVLSSKKLVQADIRLPPWQEALYAFLRRLDRAAVPLLNP